MRFINRRHAFPLRDHHLIEIFKDGKRALSTARDGTARIWDLDTGEELLRLYHEDAHDIWDALLIQNDKEVLTTEITTLWFDGTSLPAK